MKLSPEDQAQFDTAAAADAATAEFHLDGLPERSLWLHVLKWAAEGGPGPINVVAAMVVTLHEKRRATPGELFRIVEALNEQPRLPHTHPLAHQTLDFARLVVQLLFLDQPRLEGAAKALTLLIVLKRGSAPTASEVVDLLREFGEGGASGPKSAMH
jgi:hypothetical protein